MSVQDAPQSGLRPPFPSKSFPLATRVVVSWTLASALIGGGYFVSSLMLSNRMSPSHMAPAGVALFVLGGCTGLVHGGLLGYLGRRLDRPRKEGMRVVLWGAAAALIGLIPTAVLALWIAMASPALVAGRFMMSGAVLVAWVAGLVICTWAAVDGWAALRNLVARWPESRVGAPVLLGIFAVAMVAFLMQRPEIWGTDIRVTGTGAVVLAVGATVWIASPVVVVALHLVHRFTRAPFERSPQEAGSRAPMR